ncbi:MAG TPA: hypothetical protein VJB11_00205 [archaeon]|nr:hypothetical protein [archaeon]
MPKKKSKYKKQYLETWKCGDCDFEWSYRTMKCPICSENNMVKIL